MKDLKPAIYLILAFILPLFMLSCKKDKQDTNADLRPVLKTNPVSSVSQTGAVCGGVISGDGGSLITARGVCWSTNPAPDTSGCHTSDWIGAGSFISRFHGLSMNTTYHIRAYATNGNGTSYGNEITFTTGACITDIDGNEYHSCTIGDQVWMIENLRTTHYRNGDSLPLVNNQNTWANLTTGACCNYLNSENNAAEYGRLYNWFAVSDSRNIAPVGWHIPDSAEFANLIDYLGGTDSAEVKLKEAGTSHWFTPNTGATNESGFTALPGGYCALSGAFLGLHKSGYWWSSSQYLSGTARALRLDDNYYYTEVGTYPIKIGCSLRCVKD